MNTKTKHPFMSMDFKGFPFQRDGYVMPERKNVHDVLAELGFYKIPWKICWQGDIEKEKKLIAILFENDWLMEIINVVRDGVPTDFCLVQPDTNVPWYVHFESTGTVSLFSAPKRNWAEFRGIHLLQGGGIGVKYV